MGPLGLWSWPLSYSGLPWARLVLGYSRVPRGPFITKAEAPSALPEGPDLRSRQ